jgi:hypothetical protein
MMESVGKICDEKHDRPILPTLPERLQALAQERSGLDFRFRRIVWLDMPGLRVSPINDYPCII